MSASPGLSEIVSSSSDVFPRRRPRHRQAAPRESRARGNVNHSTSIDSDARTAVFGDTPLQVAVNSFFVVNTFRSSHAPHGRMRMSKYSL